MIMESRDKRWLALAVVCMGQLMMILDATIVAVALPAIKTDLHFSSSSLTWVMNAYLIAFGSFLLLGGRLGDLIGRTRMFLTGIAIFTGASMLCGLASSEAMLIGARFVQGLGAAAAASAILAQRVRAMSAYTFVSVAGGSIGLIAGGLLTQGLTWHWIFFINAPLGVLAFLAGRATLESDRGLGLGHHVDVLGSFLITGAAMIGIYAIVGSEQYGLGSARTLGLAGVAAAMLTAFLAVERRVPSPILPLEIMRLRSLMIACGVRALMVCGMWASFFVGALYLERVLGMGPVAAGAAFLPQTLTVAAFSLGPTARLTARFGERRMLLFGLTVLVAGLGLFSAVLQPGAAYFPGLFAAYALIGVGAGTSFMTLVTLALADVPAADAGIASGLVNVSVQISAALGLAVLGTIAAGQTGRLSDRGETAVHALSGGYQLAFVVAAGCVAVALLMAALFIQGPNARGAHDAEGDGSGVPAHVRAEVEPA
ncbi:MAG: MFS transporter [Actinobacteria bacterium]|nr:MAG: MFS transporter [Actinomycetota bacterium]